MSRVHWQSKPEIHYALLWLDDPLTEARILTELVENAKAKATSQFPFGWRYPILKKHKGSPPRRESAARQS